jgi:hypothetical protein
MRAKYVIRKMLQDAGYVYDSKLKAWVRGGDRDRPGVLTGRVLDDEIAKYMTADQVAAWIRAGKTDTH